MAKVKTWITIPQLLFGIFREFMKDGEIMQSHKDNYVLLDENSIFKLAILSVIGGRTDQQDSSGYELKNEEGIVVVCDGMGGHEGGKTASTLAVDTLINAYKDEYPCSDLHGLLADSLMLADSKIVELKKSDGTPMRGGSTAVAVALREHDLFWASVGDSRIYIQRGSESVKVTNDHIYRFVLEQQLDTGQITEEDYRKEIDKGEGLVSFLGIGGIPYMDTNDHPFKVQSGDRIILMSDGLYKILSDNEIGNVVNNFTDIEEALNALEYKTNKVAQKNGISRDNMTVSIIQIK